jgi:hypothetical protein
MPPQGTEPDMNKTGNSKAKTSKSAKSLFKRPPSFSRRQLAIFGLAFAVVGGYFIWQAFASAPLIATLEAERMSLPAGASIINDASASGGQAAKLTANGTASGVVSLPSNSTSLSLVARAEKCRGGWPRVSLQVDGTTVLPTTTVSSTSWHTYTATANIAAGSHNLSLIYSNTRGICQPLYADIVSFYGPIPPPPPAPTVSLSASPTTVNAGQSSTLTWNSSNADSCTASGAWSGSQPISGSTSTGALNQTSTYSLTCTGTGGSANTSVTVIVSSTGGTVPIPPTSLWDPTSDWNTDISAMSISADNSTLIADLSARGNGYIFNRSYGVGVAFADANTPTYTVTNTRYQFDGVRSVSGVPIPANARAADGNDGHMTVIVNDPNSPKYGCVYDWFEAVANSSGVETSASYFDMTKTSHNGWLGLTRGSSANNLAGVLWPQHLDGSVPINFALSMWVDSSRGLSGSALRPSLTTDGSGGSTKLPEGARLRLRSDFNLSGYPAWLQRIGTAMKTYGVRVIDQHGGAPALVAVGYSNGQATSLPSGWDAYGSGQLPVAFLQNMQVVTWSSQDIQQQIYRPDADTTVCGTYNR